MVCWSQHRTMRTLSATAWAAGLIWPSVSCSAAGTARSAMAWAAGLMPCSVAWWATFSALSAKACAPGLSWPSVNCDEHQCRLVSECFS